MEFEPAHIPVLYLKTFPFVLISSSPTRRCSEDLKLPGDEAEKPARELAAALHWSGPVYLVSAVTGEGCEKLCQQVMNHLESGRHDKPELPDTYSTDKPET